MQKVIAVMFFAYLSYPCLVKCKEEKVKMLGKVNLFIVDCEICPEYTELPVTLDFSGTMDGEYQLVNLSWYFPFEVGGPNFPIVLIIDAEIPGKNRFVQFVKKQNEDFCKMAHSYAGAVMRDVERIVGYEEMKCPFPKGRYGLVNYRIDTSMIPYIQNLVVPRGKFRYRIEVDRNATKIFCVVGTIFNRPL